MAPKKKNNNKNDDWDADLGETIEPIAAAVQAAKDTEAANDDEEDAAPVSGLLASLRKNKGKRAKKGKAVEDFVEGEDPEPVNGVNGHEEEDAAAMQEAALAAKAPEEANMDDEDVFGAPIKKGKGGKGAKGSKQQSAGASEQVSRTASPAPAAASPAPPAEEGGDDDEEDDEADTGGKILTKKEKEKLKKEREKQRKKENVSFLLP